MATVAAQGKVYLLISVVPVILRSTWSTECKLSAFDQKPSCFTFLTSLICIHIWHSRELNSVLGPNFSRGSSGHLRQDYTFIFIMFIGWIYWIKVIIHHVHLHMQHADHSGTKYHVYVSHSKRSRERLMGKGNHGYNYTTIKTHIDVDRWTIMKKQKETICTTNYEFQ